MPLSPKSTLTLVDGRSGAGKSVWAQALALELDATLISLDDVYPGWDGLDAGSAHVFSRVVIPFAEGKLCTYTTWDWAAWRPGTQVTVNPSRALVIEGCGAIREGSDAFATRLVWIDAAEEVRKERAVARDGQMFIPYWRRWALQEERFIVAHDSQRLAGDILSGE